MFSIFTTFTTKQQKKGKSAPSQRYLARRVHNRGVDLYRVKLSAALSESAALANTKP